MGTGAGGATGVLPTPQDSVEEFKVNTAGQTADFNSSAGSEVKVVTKRGTDAWHGTGYEYYKDNNWSSNSWQNNDHAGTPADPKIPIPSFHYSRYGGAVGGPIIPKNVLGGKTYLFFNYEGFSFPNSETIVRNVPSPTLRLGLLTDDKTGVLYNLNPYSVTYNGTTYAANQGCAGVCDPRSTRSESTRWFRRYGTSMNRSQMLLALRASATTPGWKQFEHSRIFGEPCATHD